MYNVIGFVWIDKVSMCSDGQPRQTWKWEKRGGRGTASPAILVARDWVARVNQTEVASSGDGRTEVSEKNKRGTGSRPGVVPHRIYAAGELKSSMILCSWERICTDLNSHISNPLPVPGNGVSHKRPHTHKSRETVNRPLSEPPQLQLVRKSRISGGLSPDARSLSVWMVILTIHLAMKLPALHFSHQTYG